EIIRASHTERQIRHQQCPDKHDDTPHEASVHNRPRELTNVSFQTAILQRQLFSVSIHDAFSSTTIPHSVSPPAASRRLNTTAHSIHCSPPTGSASWIKTHTTAS